jgi:hypothetical protein
MLPPPDISASGDADAVLQGNPHNTPAAQPTNHCRHAKRDAAASGLNLLHRLKTAGRCLARSLPSPGARTAHAVLDLPQTNMLIERLCVDKSLRRLCGWEHVSEVPSEATFSRAFDVQSST